MKAVYSYLVAALLFLVWGCGEKSAEQLYQGMQEAVADTSSYQKAEKLLEKLLVTYPEDERCDDALFALAQTDMSRGKGAEAVAKYQQLLSQYPQSELCYKAQFMIGFVYSEMIQDHEKARGAYQKVIDDYPDCDLVVSARWMRENMGKEPEELEILDK